jgi:hypothetical protein
LNYELGNQALPFFQDLPADLFRQAEDFPEKRFDHCRKDTERKHVKPSPGSFRYLDLLARTQPVCIGYNVQPFDLTDGTVVFLCKIPQVISWFDRIVEEVSVVPGRRRGF